MSKWRTYGLICLLLCAAAIVSALGLSKAGSAVYTALTYEPPVTVVIDAGHGENQVSLHNGKIVFDEKVMISGVSAMSRIALEYLKK